MQVRLVRLGQATPSEIEHGLKGGTVVSIGRHRFKPFVQEGSWWQFQPCQERKEKNDASYSKRQSARYMAIAKGVRC